MLSEEPHPKVGFSADVIFTAIEKKVQTILRVLSVDLVFNPARGGAFLRALNNTRSVGVNSVQAKESVTMPESTTSTPKPELTQEQLTKDQAAIRSLLDEQNRQQALAAEAEKARAIRVQMCSYLLDSGLAASRLPTPAQDRIRKQFKDQVFEPADLQTAIDDTRNMISEIAGSSTVQGPGRIHAMFDSADRLQAAMDDLLGAPRDKGKEELQAPRSSGIRELYLALTGDYDLHGGFYPDRVQLATTADFTGLVKNAMNKIIVNQWEQLGEAGYDWWKSIATVDHFGSLQSITGTLIGTVGSLPVVAEGAEYTELAVGDSPETASFVKYGGYIPLTLELIDRDDANKLKAYPRELASAGLRKISALVAAIFTAAAGLGPTMADTGTLFNATAVTTLGGHANLLTTALSATQWEVVSAAMYNQPLLIKQAAGYYGSGPVMALNPKYCLVPRAIQWTARKVLLGDWENTTNIHADNLLQGASGDVITVPDWTDANDWAAVADPRVAPAIFIGERFGLMPQIFIAGDSLSPAVFMNDETRLKVRHFLAVWVNDFRPLHKENVT
jgi:hypothetical protein